MTKEEHTEYVPKWDWKLLLLFAAGSLMLQGCRMGLESAEVFYFSSVWWIYGGIFALIIGLVTAGADVYMGLGRFFGNTKYSNSSVNASVICAAGCMLIAKNFLINIILIILISAALSGMRYFISAKQCARLNRYIGKTGTAMTDISDQGEGKFGVETIKLKAAGGHIKKGVKIRITDIEGFCLVAEQIKR